MSLITQLGQTISTVESGCAAYRNDSPNLAIAIRTIFRSVRRRLYAFGLFVSSMTSDTSCMPYPCNTCRRGDIYFQGYKNGNIAQTTRSTVCGQVGNAGSSDFVLHSLPCRFIVCSAVPLCCPWPLRSLSSLPSTRSCCLTWSSPNPRHHRPPSHSARLPQRLRRCLR